MDFINHITLISCKINKKVEKKILFLAFCGSNLIYWNKLGESGKINISSDLHTSPAGIINPTARQPNNKTCDKISTNTILTTKTIMTTT